MSNQDWAARAYEDSYILAFNIATIEQPKWVFTAVCQYRDDALHLMQRKVDFDNNHGLHGHYIVGSFDTFRGVVNGFTEQAQQQLYRKNPDWMSSYRGQLLGLKGVHRA